MRALSLDRSNHQSALNEVSWVDGSVSVLLWSWQGRVVTTGARSRGRSGARSRGLCDHRDTFA